MSAGRVGLLAAMLAALLVAAGCGSSGGDDVTVQTGSLSKAEFVKKADAICTAARSQLVSKFYGFLNSHSATVNSANPKAREELLGEAVDSVVAPNVEGEIKQISTLGAPDDYASEVASFLTELRERLNEVHEEPGKLMAASGTPFKQAGEAAQQAGLNGCATSLS